MATITSAGIGSGLDVESLITKLMSLERQPVTQLQQRTDTLKTQLSAIGKLQSSVATLRDAAGRLALSTSFTGTVASSSDASSVAATAGTEATAGSYQVNVEKLAKAQSLVSPAGASLSTGTVTIEFGTYSTDLSAFTADPGRAPMIIPVGAGEAQLDKIRDKINALKAGVVANVVTDVNGSRLVMRATDGGAANAFRVSVADDDGNNTDASGLSALAYDPTAAVNTGSRTQAAQNSVATIDGVRVESATNTVSSAVQGVTFTLGKEMAVGSQVTINVTQDSAGTKKLITDFVSAYNDTVKLLRDQTKNDPNGTSGPLKGDSGVIGILNQLRQEMGASTTLGGSLARLADIGLDPLADGTLKINSTKLDAALAKPTDLQGLFAGLDGGNAANNGFGQRLRTLADGFLSTDGRIDAQQKGLQSRISANDKRGDELNRRLELVEKRLRTQYTALDGTMGKYNGLSTYLQQQLSKL